MGRSTGTPEAMPNMTRVKEERARERCSHSGQGLEATKNSLPCAWQGLR